MAKILCIETATTNCSVSISENGKLLAFKEENSDNYKHSEQLHVFIGEVVEEASLKLSDLDAIAVSKGPGSYTGLRIGVSAAKGLCFALDVPLISILTLESMAHKIKAQDDEVIIPLLDARRMEVYSAVFDSAYIQVRETKAEIVDEASFSEYQTSRQIYLIGDGAEKCKDLLTNNKFKFIPTIYPSSNEMAQLSYGKFKKGDFEDVAYFEPFYLKDFILGGAKKN